MSRDFFDNAEKSTELVYRYLAWLTALRYQLRENRPWETLARHTNAEYLKYYSIPEMQTALEMELMKYLPDAGRLGAGSAWRAEAGSIPVRSSCDFARS